MVNKSLKGNWEIEKASFASYHRRDEICDHGSTTQRCPNTSGSRHPSPSTQPPVDPVEVNKVFSSFFFQLLASLFHHPSVLHVLGWFVPFGSISVFFHMLASFLLYILYYPSLGLHISPLFNVFPGVFCTVCICVISFLLPCVFVHVPGSHGILISVAHAYSKPAIFASFTMYLLAYGFVKLCLCLPSSLLFVLFVLACFLL